MKNTRSQKREWPFVPISRTQYRHWHDCNPAQLRKAADRYRAEGRKALQSEGNGKRLLRFRHKAQICAYIGARLDRIASEVEAKGLDTAGELSIADEKGLQVSPPSVTTLLKEAA